MLSVTLIAISWLVFFFLCCSFSIFKIDNSVISRTLFTMAVKKNTITSLVNASFNGVFFFFAWCDKSIELYHSIQELVVSYKTRKVSILKIKASYNGYTICFGHTLEINRIRGEKKKRMEQKNFTFFCVLI